jgi:hypothetical protein
MEDMLGIRYDMTQLSTNIDVELAELKNLLLNMSCNNRGRKQRRNKDCEA